MRRRLAALIVFVAPLAAPAAAQGPASPEAARGVIESYYAAIDRGGFRAAYLCWDRGGAASGKSYAAFRAGFARTARTRVTTYAPTGREGAAGSSFITVPVDVRATLKNGARQHFRGRYVLRRVNDVSGASPEHLRWHIASARLVAVR